MLGVGVPLPVLDESVVAHCAVQDKDVVAPVMDFSIPRRVRPTFGLVSYAQLKSGKLTIEGKTIKVAPVASIARSRQVAEELKQWIDNGDFTLTEPVASLPSDRTFIAQDRWGSQLSME
jgi:uncharacterized protein (DUF39 family)